MKLEEQEKWLRSFGVTPENLIELERKLGLDAPDGFVLQVWADKGVEGNDNVWRAQVVKRDRSGDVVVDYVWQSHLLMAIASALRKL